MLRLTNIKIPVGEPADLKQRAARIMKVPPASVHEIRVARQSVDARRSHTLSLVYTLSFQWTMKRRYAERTGETDR